MLFLLLRGGGKELFNKIFHKSYCKNKVIGLMQIIILMTLFLENYILNIFYKEDFFVISTIRQLC